MSSMEEDERSEGIWMLPYRITFVFLLSVGIAVNYKLFHRVRNETTGERGKAFQQIVKSYAMIQVIGWPCIWMWFAVWQWIILMKFDSLFPPCIYVYAYHTGIFAYILQRCYVAFHSLILALGRYIFVVHDNLVLDWGIKRVSRALVISSFFVPLFMAILTDSVLQLQYNGWLGEIRVYEARCSISSGEHIMKENMVAKGHQEYFSSPFYSFVHEQLPSWATKALFIFAIVIATTLFSNISEGIIYIKCAIFVFR